MLRQVIVAILGNVDSGKSKLVETIKKISILASEPGKITQSIGLILFLWMQLRISARNYWTLKK